MPPSHMKTRTHEWRGLILLSVFITLIYSNTFHTEWHFDDYPNILQNPSVRIERLTPGHLFNSFFDQRQTDPLNQGRLYRPVANLSLALNWYLGGDQIFGYHVVNLLIHLLTTMLLYFTIKSLFMTPRLRTHDQTQAHLIALLATTLWAANPIQTQAITYVIQRMASLATLFYLAGVFGYLQARGAEQRRTKILWYVGCLVGFLLAVGSKENAILLPLALGLIEIVFYQDLGRLKANKRFIRTVVLSVVAVIVVGLALFALFKGSPIDYFQRRYADRPFSLGQRLLTEPRVLVLYLSQLFYPVPHRLAVMHDIDISTSLLVPWTTLPAIALVLGLIGIGCHQAAKRPLISFGILFYFLNHLVESTVFPLELAFEHRNYLPSLFIFLGPAAGLVLLIDSYRRRNKVMAGVVSVGLTVIIVFLGLGTYTRNLVWQTQRTLWEDVAIKYPGLARPLQNLADIHDRAGQSQKAIELYSRAMHLNDPRPEQSRILSLNNLGNIYFKLGAYDKAIQSYEAVLKIDADYDRARLNLAQVLVVSDQLEDALEQAEYLLSREADHPKFLNIKGHILVKLDRPEEALMCFNEALKSSPYNRNALLNLGVGLMTLGDHKEAHRYLSQAAQLYPDDIMIVLRQIENALLGKNQAVADRHLARLLEKRSITAVERIIQGLPYESRLLPINHHLLQQAIQAYVAHNILIDES